MDDLTATFLGVGGLVIYLSLNKTRLFDLLPEPPSEVFENSLDGILILDNQYRILAANRAANLFLSVTKNIIIGSPLEDVMPQWTEYLTRMQTTTDQEHGYVFLRGDRIFEIRLVLVNNNSFDSDRKLLFIRDETMRLRAQHEMEINQKKYHALYENMLNGVIIFETDNEGHNFTIQTLNQYALDNLMFKEQDTPKQRINELLPVKYFKGLWDAIPQVWLSAEPARLPTIKSNENGNDIWRDFSLYKFSDTEVIALYKDIREEMSAKENLTLTNRELEHYVKQLEFFNSEVLILNQFGQQLQSCLNFNDVAQTVHLYTSRLFPEQKVQLIIFDLFHESFVYSDYGENSEFISDFLNNKIIKSLPFNVIREFGIQDFESQQIHIKRNSKENWIVPYLFFVCRFGNDKLVMIILDNSTPGMDQKHRQHLSSIVERMVLALSNIDLKEQLTYQALHDEITGFYNRRYLADYLPREIHRAERYHHNLSLIMLDVDYFKHFNDTYGHLLGDLILEKISTLISSLLRKSDLSFRYGGEEFLLVLPETTLLEAKEKAEVIRSAIHDLSIEWQEQPLEKVSISGGISSFPELTQSSEELIQQADSALYRAKEDGRNQIQIFHPSRSV
jgi:diguanylate cyclase (GGDEF)-like protein